MCVCDPEGSEREKEKERDQERREGGQPFHSGHSITYLVNMYACIVIQDVPCEKMRLGMST